MYTGNPKDGNCSRVMVIVKLKDESMGDFILFVHINVEAEYPDVKDENSNSTPCREVPGECAILLQCYVVNCNNND
jgi:hypothetical protein